MKKIKAWAIVSEEFDYEEDEYGPRVLTPLVLGMNLAAIFFDGTYKGESAEKRIKEFRKYWPGERGELKNVPILISFPSKKPKAKKKI